MASKKAQMSKPDGLYESQAHRLEIDSRKSTVPLADDEFYNMSHPNRGIALIFNHLFFDGSLCKPRRGTDHDRNNMQSVLETMGFLVKVYNDFTRHEIMEILEIVSKMDHSDNDCLVVTILSHGGPYGTIYARDGQYNTNEVLHKFSGTKCPSLAGKPKLFFIQACRGDRADSGATVQSDSASRDEEFYTIPNLADILIMYATVEGYFAWRDTGSGSWFIQSLCKMLQKHYKTREILSILTLVNRDVAIGYETEIRQQRFGMLQLAQLRVSINSIFWHLHFLQ